jgi:hypothetical protein
LREIRVAEIFETASRALAREVMRRVKGRDFEAGGWYHDGQLLLVTNRTMLSVRAWGGRAASHWLDAREPEPRWQVAVPHIDLAAGRIANTPHGARAVRRHGRLRVVREVAVEGTGWPRGTRGDAVPLPRRRRRRPADDGQLLLPLDEGESAAAHNERVRARANFFAEMPTRARQCIAPTPERWHWQLLVLADDVGDAVCDLLESTPALALGLAVAPLFARDALPETREVVNWRQPRIAELLGFPASRRAVRALRKLPARELDPEALLILRRLLHDDRVVARIAHLPRLSRTLLSVARTPDCFLALSRDSQLGLLDARLGPELARRLEPLLSRITQARQRGFRVPRTIQSSAHAEVVAEAVSELMYEVGPLDAPDQVPAPPYPGVPGRIEPLRCVGDYDEEGRLMHNCVLSMLPHALGGYIVVYRVLEPERATVSLARTREGWRLDQLQATGNSPVRAETRREVERWLALWRGQGLQDGSDCQDDWTGEPIDPEQAGAFVPADAFDAFAPGDDVPVYVPQVGDDVPF